MQKQQNQLYRLKSNVIAEPLINGWYAWIGLISPMTYCKYMHYHIQLLKSYLELPILHKQASKEKRLQGGAFVDLEESKIAQIELLLQSTENALKSIYLADAYDKINSLLEKYNKENNNFDELYNIMPDNIKGLVEFTSDTRNQIDIKFYENLMYQSEYYNNNYQSVLLYEHDPDTRSFALSTPRIQAKNSVNIKLPFINQFYDELFRARSKPLNIIEIKNIYEQYLKHSKISYEKFSSFFEMQNSNYKISHESNKTTKELSITYIGHACVLIETQDLNIIIDPMLAYDKTVSNIKRYTFTELPETIDYALITHTHQDHFVIESLLQIRHKIKNIVVPRNNYGALQDPSPKLALQHIGFDNIIELSELDKIEVNHHFITAIPFLGEHGDLDIRSKTGFCVSINKQNILFMADSRNIAPELYTRLAKVLPPIDIIFLGLESKGAPLSWLYGPIMQCKLSHTANISRRLNGSNAEQAYKLIKSFNCRNVFIYAMGHEPWLKFISNIEFDPNSEQMQEAYKLKSMCEQDVNVDILYGSKEIEITTEELTCR